MTWWWGALGAAAVAAAAYALRWLSPSGAAVATLLGAAVMGGAGLVAAVPIGVFFVTGSALTRAGAPARDAAARTGVQVLANAWTALAGAALIPVSPELGWAALLGGLGTAHADTWATEIGRWSGPDPVLITTGTRVAPGTSGGVTLLGTFGGIAGAGSMALVAALIGSRVSPLAVLGAAVVGMMADSLFGAALQARYRCAVCQRWSETPRHACGTVAQRVGGIAFIGNNAVNAIATGTGAATAMFLQRGFG